MTKRNVHPMFPDGFPLETGDPEPGGIRPTLAGYALRLPVELKKALEVQAFENERSLNAEIIYRLRASLNSYRR